MAGRLQQLRCIPRMPASPELRINLFVHEHVPHFLGRMPSSFRFALHSDGDGLRVQYAYVPRPAQRGSMRLLGLSSDRTPAFTVNPSFVGITYSETRTDEQ
jgi:hypothetical protein